MYHSVHSLLLSTHSRTCVRENDYARAEPHVIITPIRDHMFTQICKYICMYMCSY